MTANSQLNQAAEPTTTGGSLVLGRVERYIIEQRSNGIALRMRQAKNALGVAALSAGVLLLSWWFGPYGPRSSDAGGFFYWIWSGFWAVIVIAGLLGALRREDWTITDRETVVTTSFAGWRSARRLPRTRQLAIRVELRESAGEGRVFPWRLHVLDDNRNVSGLSVHVQRRRSVDRFLETLRAALPLDVEDSTERSR
jgi:hypothetical protein